MEWLRQILDRLLSVFPQLALVNPDEGGVRITLGKWVKLLGPGWYFYWPIIQSIPIITVTPQVKDARVQSVWTLDQVDLCVSLAIKYRVKDAQAALLKVQDYDQSLQNSALVACVEFIGEMDRDDLVVDGLKIDVQDVSITDIGRTRNIRLLTNPTVTEIADE
jgi:regulator of protease activity HflC (stomatin/prohibitin superfamily)